MELKYKINNNTGFIALMTSIIISSVLFLSVTSASTVSFYSRFSVLDYELKSKTREQSLACLEATKLRLGEEINYETTDGLVFIPESPAEYCRIISIKNLGDEIFIETQAKLGRLSTKIKTVLDNTTLNVLKSVVEY